MPDYLRVRDIVRILEVNEDTVRLWLRQKKLPAMKIGRTYYIDPKDFQKFLDDRRTDREEKKE